MIQDDTFCHGVQVREYCCPANAVIPGCGLHDFNNGKCGKNYNSVCPASRTYVSEVGSYNGACSDKQTFQVACCDSDSAIVKFRLWRLCVGWHSQKLRVSTWLPDYRLPDRVVTALKPGQWCGVLQSLRIGRQRISGRLDSKLLSSSIRQ